MRRISDSKWWKASHWQKLAGQLYQERSRQGVGDFSLTQRIRGYWDKAGTELDFVAVNEEDEIIRFGSCKRSPSKLISDINNFKGQADRFLKAFPEYKAWKVQYAGIAPMLDREQRAILKLHDVIPRDLNDLVLGLR